MLDNGIYLPPSAFETWFISEAIGSKELELTLEAVDTFSL
jgi:glutamate-1-semialdehyde 2,1-aminomutase